ncbi:MAG: UDP-N-acetylmuramate dehydrogenase [Bacteroidales bacterium]
MQVITDFPLKGLNTFGFDVRSAFYTELSDIALLPRLMEIVPQYEQGFYILGGGSNVLFAEDFPGLLVGVNCKGRYVLDQSQEHVWVKAMAGEDWDAFVDWCVENNWGGLENLTMIPGRVGTSPMQNIGAYGVEIKDCFHQLEAWDLSKGKMVVFGPEECRFGYRDSIFKQEGKGKYIIVSVTFRLTLKDHKLTLDYGPVKQELEHLRFPGLRDVVNVIRAIRSEKLPDPLHTGNAGSFFKNPVIAPEHFLTLQQQYPGMPHFDLGQAGVKVPAGWLIEQCGWKGKRYANAGVHHKQALVLVNLGNATGGEVLKLAEAIQQSVNDKFGISLEREVNLVTPLTLMG